MRACVLILATLATAPLLLAQPPVITNQPTNRTLWVGCNVSFAARATGGGSFTYQWMLNGTNLPNGIITTVAGNGKLGYSGDGGPATNAELVTPSGVALDATGNLYIADYGSGAIRRVSTSGVITTVAGDGIDAYSGNDIPATNASIGGPTGVAVDTSGNLFITDIRDGLIRRVGTNGIITTVAGGGDGSYSGDGGPATNAGLAFPFGVAVDAFDNLFIADSDDNRIREVGTNGIITTVAGGGTNNPSDGGPATNVSLGWPSGVRVDAFGDLFIADNDNGCVRKVNTNGIMTTVAGDGTQGFSGDGGIATNATLASPWDVAADNSGDVFIVDDANNRIREVSTNGIITTVAGNGSSGFVVNGDGGPATNAGLNLPVSVVVDTFGNLFIGDTDNQRIRKVTNTQGPTLALNNATPGNAGSYQVVVTGSGGSVTSSVASLTVASAPLVYVTVVNADGSLTLSFVSQPSSANVVLCASNLSPPIFWQPLSTNLAGPDGDWQFTDTNAVAFQARFYRSLTPW